ncbi:MAG: bifunctional diguanylate cyclase/phosphodiesterase [Sphingobium sp.]
MFRVIECIWTQHDHVTVALAAMIWIIGSLAFFLALEQAHQCRQDRRALWLAIGALAGGLGVWATHFVAMLAYKGGLPIGYALRPTIMSAAIIIIGFWAALQTLGQFTFSRCMLAGLTLATSIGLMHFTGMDALLVQAHIQYDWSAVAVSAVVAGACFTAAFYLFTRLPGIWHIPGSALASVVGVCALHFTGMSATTLVFDPALPPVEINTSRIWLIGATVVSTLIVVLLTGVATLIDRYLTDLKGLASATLEGIVIVRDNHIVEANERFAEWIGISELAGMDPECLLAAVDGCPIADLRDKPVEAVPRGEYSDRVFEVAVHEIEYRGRPSRVLAVRDLTDAKAAQRQIEHLAHHDGLTGLPNRTLLQERLDHALALSERTDESLALLTLDLDRFKAVNDLFGHAEGDRVLKAVATMLKRCVRGADTVARLGGDEFVILQVGAPQPEGARAMADRILEIFRGEMNPAMDPTAVGVSAGVALFPQDGQDAASLHHAADIALYRAKTSGRGNIAFFDSDMDRQMRQRRQLESDLRHAVARKQFHIVYQPLVDTDTRRITGYEALLRWTQPGRGAVEPDEFIPIAEETGIILALGEWVLRQACQDAASWLEPFTLAVNISPVQFQIANLEDIVVSALADAGLEATRLELEITETALMKDRDRTIRTLNALKRRGIRIVMDDFGTGYSSLSNLQSFSFDKIKIDRSFIQTMENDEAARSIIRAIVGIGRSLALPVVAEGVETETQRAMVEHEGCPQAQGFFYGLPGVGPAIRASTSDALTQAVA